MTDTNAPEFSQWAIVDVMGHSRYVGFVSETVIAGNGFIQVNIPAVRDKPAWTKIIGPKSIYEITPISEELAREMAAARNDQPIQAYELPQPKLNGFTDDDIPM